MSITHWSARYYTGASDEFYTQDRGLSRELRSQFWYSGVSVDIPACPLNYRLETQEQLVPTDDPSLTQSIWWSLNT